MQLTEILERYAKFACILTAGYLLVSVADYTYPPELAFMLNNWGAAFAVELKVMRSEGSDQLIEVSMGMKDFSSEWTHCDRMSSFIARLVCQSRADSLLYANLFSSALNELLETVFSNHGAEGDLTCRVRRSSEADTIELSIPCDTKTLQFYTDVVNSLDRQDIEQLYHAALFSSGQRDARLGIFELAVDYKAKISVLSGAGRMTLSAEIVLGGAS